DQWERWKYQPTSRPVNQSEFWSRKYCELGRSSQLRSSGSRPELRIFGFGHDTSAWKDTNFALKEGLLTRPLPPDSIATKFDRTAAFCKWT
ncbi:1580_t:CDS:1, partial [Paraglomus occultum]